MQAVNVLKRVEATVATGNRGANEGNRIRGTGEVVGVWIDSEKIGVAGVLNHNRGGTDGVAIRDLELKDFDFAHHQIAGDLHHHAGDHATGANHHGAGQGAKQILGLHTGNRVGQDGAGSDTAGSDQEGDGLTFFDTRWIGSNRQGRHCGIEHPDCRCTDDVRDLNDKGLVGVNHSIGDQGDR